MGNKSGASRRTDIPYAQRLQLQRRAEIVANREEAARVSLQPACIALNDLEGMGYTRLCRFADRVKALIDEYYEDQEVGAAHMARRLEQMGFLMKDGVMHGAVDPETGKFVPVKWAQEAQKG